LVVSWKGKKPETIAAQRIPAHQRPEKLVSQLEKPPYFSYEVISPLSKWLKKLIKP